MHIAFFEGALHFCSHPLIIGPLSIGVDIHIMSSKDFGDHLRKYLHVQANLLLLAGGGGREGSSHCSPLFNWL